ncbi:MAG: oxidoreductase [Rhodobacterales bacterium]|nr:MAG: oxidoreductase [Rhodobacterales bacterium]
MSAPRAVALVGCGFVADLYMRGFETFPDIEIHGVHDQNPARREAFCGYWKQRAFDSLDALLADLPGDALVLNLTNPSAHYEINGAVIDAGHHVFCEKPLAMTYRDAADLIARAKTRGVQIGSAPSSVLGEAAQMLGRALRDDVAGTPRLVYAEMDDGFIPQAPVRDWKSESGAPWPFEDEFRTGCTLEHAGYYLSWLIAMFGPVARVVAASTEVIPDKLGVTGAAPDFSVATLFFETGVVARLTCSIAAPHDHRIRVIGDEGVLEVKAAWANGAPVKYHRRLRIRRRLLEHPLGKRIKPPAQTHPKVGRRGAASMNFALGPAEMLDAITQGRPSRIGGDYALHLTEVTLAIQMAGRAGLAEDMQSRCDPMPPMEWAT